MITINGLQFVAVKSGTAACYQYFLCISQINRKDD